MSFPKFKKAIKQIPVAEIELKIEELKFEWRKLKLKLEEITDEQKRKEIDAKKNAIKKEIWFVSHL